MTDMIEITRGGGTSREILSLGSLGLKMTDDACL
jgi:hypothetical protein